MQTVSLTPPEVTALLLRIGKHEQAGLRRRTAVLTAGAELGIDPAAVLRIVREVGP